LAQVQLSEDGRRAVLAIITDKKKGGRAMGFDFDNKTVLITGGTGSWGQEFTRQILEGTRVKELRIYSRGEYQQVEMRRIFQRDTRVKFLIGDVRDKERLCFATKNVDGIIHLAALKHVPVVEEHLWEALQTNTIGSQNVIEAAWMNGPDDCGQSRDIAHALCRLQSGKCDGVCWQCDPGLSETVGPREYHHLNRPENDPLFHQ
jgi:hypothetical protein